LDRYRTGAPPCLLAAPVPWIDDVLLLPALLTMPRADPAADGVDKRWKRYRWVDEVLWFQLVSGDALDAVATGSTRLIHGNTILAAGAAATVLTARLAALGAQATPGVRPALWHVGTAPHVTIDRRAMLAPSDTDAYRGVAVPYQRGATWFAAGADLALPVRWADAADDATRQLIERALVFLGDTGLGGERSAGYGQFDLVGSEERDWPNVEAGADFATLTDLAPTADEVAGGLFDPPAAYAIVRTGGWVERGGPFHALRLVQAGSMLRGLPGRQAYGRLVPLREPSGNEHPVYRYGYAFPLPVGPSGGD
jgi:CRISPR-associated protein Csm4